jgi:hypothetical protein
MKVGAKEYLLRNLMGMNCEERLQRNRPALRENFPNGPAFSPNFNRGTVERAHESSIYVKRAFYFITPLMPGVTKVTQSDPGSNVNSVPQEEHQRQRMRLELWFTSISSPLQSCSGTMSL